MRTPRGLFTSLIGLLGQLALLEALQSGGNASSLFRGESEDGGIGEGGLVLANPSPIRPNEDPENTSDIVMKARKNEFSSEMITNWTRAVVFCETGEIVVKINFTEPFRGIGYADYDPSSACKFFGDGASYYEMRLPLKGCGTKQEAPRLFVNNIVLRHHRSLELEEDEVKTIVCRYPPPEAPAPPPPPGVPARIIDAPPTPARLTQYEPFVLIAGLLFFALLLAGLGTTSYVVRKETIKPINTPLPITSQTEFDTYIDTQSVKTIEDLDTTHKIMPLPKLSTHTFDDVYITNIHEIVTEEDLVHSKQMLPKPRMECQNFEDTFITNQDEIISEEVLQQRNLKRQQRPLGREECDDVYITNQDEVVEDERIMHHKMMMEKPKLEVRTIEDTFITNVDEIIEREDTTHHKGHGRGHYEELEERLERLDERERRYDRES